MAKNAKVAKIAKKAMVETVKNMTPDECLKAMPKLMGMFGGDTPQMKKMMGTK